MTMPNDLEETVVLVTGAGSGLGEATARAFAKAGSIIVLVDRNAESIDRLVQELGTAGGNHVALPCDVSDAGSVLRTVDETMNRFGHIDIVVNCAAIDHTYWVEQLAIEQWDQVIAVNLRGPFLVAKAVWTPMRERGGGHTSTLRRHRRCGPPAAPQPTVPRNSDCSGLAGPSTWRAARTRSGSRP